MTGLLPKTAYGSNSFMFEDAESNTVQKLVVIVINTVLEMNNGAKGMIRIIGNTKHSFEESIRIKNETGVSEIHHGVRSIPKNGSSYELPPNRPDNYPKNKIDEIIGSIKNNYQSNYASAVSGIRTSWLTNVIL